MVVSSYIAIKKFLHEHAGDHWEHIVRACLVEAERTQGQFAGAWVLREVKKHGVGWFPNLRPLVACGVLRRTEVNRGGKRAYYEMLDPQGVKTALRELGVL